MKKWKDLSKRLHMKRRKALTESLHRKKQKDLPESLHRKKWKDLPEILYRKKQTGHCKKHRRKPEETWTFFRNRSIDLHHITE